MLLTEPNFQRKSHRVDIPLFVEIDDRLYQAIDWSITGLAIREDASPYPLDAVVTARILLPLEEARLSLDVRLVTRRKGGGEVGFEFLELSPKSRRILRHYIQLYVDGKLDNAEDLVAISAAPVVDTPLNEALNLSEDNTEALIRSFKHRGMIAAVLILLFLIVFVGVLFYNTTYRLETTGVVIGNIDRVTANYGGVLQQVDARTGTYVRAGTPLFRLKNTGASAQSARATVQRLSTGRALAAERALLKSLGQTLALRRQAYRNASTLYEKRLITRKDLENVENGYVSSRTAYLRQKAVVDGATVRRVSLGGGGGGEPLYPEIRAPHDGQVLAVSGKPGAYVGASDVVVILQRNDKVPQVAISVDNKEALKLHVGMPAQVYVPFQGRRYGARITAIGRAAINTAATETMEASLNETLVSLSFDDKSVRLPFDARVRVWIKTF